MPGQAGPARQGQARPDLAWSGVAMRGLVRSDYCPGLGRPGQAKSEQAWPSLARLDELMKQLSHT